MYICRRFLYISGPTCIKNGGKDQQDWSDLVVNAPPLYIEEKVHPKALIDNLLWQTRETKHEQGEGLRME
jgi:hypothetical protein